MTLSLTVLPLGSTLKNLLSCTASQGHRLRARCRVGRYKIPNRPSSCETNDAEVSGEVAVKVARELQEPRSLVLPPPRFPMSIFPCTCDGTTDGALACCCVLININTTNKSMYKTRNTEGPILATPTTQMQLEPAFATALSIPVFPRISWIWGFCARGPYFNGSSLDNDGCSRSHKVRRE